MVGMVDMVAVMAAMDMEVDRVMDITGVEVMAIILHIIIQITILNTITLGITHNGIILRIYSHNFKNFLYLYINGAFKKN
jgi:hypothetical protein